jgi:hypothetical protein
MPLQATSGAASYDAFGGGVPAVPNYIEEVFSTYLYTGNSTARSITNDIDLSTKGGLVWLKNRSVSVVDPQHTLTDTARGATKWMESSGTGAQVTTANTLTAFNTNGFSLGVGDKVNENGITYASWTFRKQPKFFDVVTYTGTGSARTVAHNLGSVPGMMIVKRTDSTGDWRVYHRSLSNTEFVSLNLTSAVASDSGALWNSTTPTSTVFSIGTSANVNASGATYVAYLFAHDAGGFGLTGTDNVISCGSYTGTGSTLSITLGYEPQWVMIKRTDTTADWQIIDNMRGWTADGVCQRLVPNTSAAEAGPTGSTFLFPTATGFGSAGSSAIVNASGGTYIYIAIRRGPMKVPTSGTSVFDVDTQTGAGTSAGQTITTNFPVDLEISMGRDAAYGNVVIDRLRGGQNYLLSQSTAAEVNFTSYTPLVGFANNTGITDANYGSTTASYVAWNFRRAPSFFDEVCYTGTGSLTTITHNLAAVPELIFVKRRSATNSWYTYNSTIGAANILALNLTIASTADNAAWNSTSPTSTVFTVNTESAVNFSGQTYVAYLFASCAGVSKVGSYTGTATTKQIDCGFTGGARFVLIKRTDSTGDWYVWDSARGIVSGNDPYLLMNSSATEVTSTDYIDTYSAGFEISSTAPAAINASGGTFIFLAIA